MKLNKALLKSLSEYIVAYEHLINRVDVYNDMPTTKNMLGVVDAENAVYDTKESVAKFVLSDSEMIDQLIKFHDIMGKVLGRIRQSES